MAATQPQPIDRSDAVHRNIQRRNRLVLLALLAFVAFAFAVSFYHVAREARGAAANQQSHATSDMRASHA